MKAYQSCVLSVLVICPSWASVPITCCRDFFDEDIMYITIPSLLATSAALVVHQTASSPALVFGARAVMAVGYATCSIVPLWRMMQSSTQRDLLQEESAL